LNRFPAKWRGSYTHTLLLNKIDPRLTTVPVNHTHVQFDKMSRLKQMDRKDNSIRYIKLKRFFIGGNAISGSSNALFKTLLTDTHKNLHAFKNVINIQDAVRKYNLLGGDYNSITTLNIYLTGIERRFQSKIEN